MDDFWWWMMDVVGPVILLILLVWLAFRWGNRRPGTREDEIAERGARDAYAEEEVRRREGTDDL